MPCRKGLACHQIAAEPKAPPSRGRGGPHLEAGSPGFKARAVETHEVHGILRLRFPGSPSPSGGAGADSGSMNMVSNYWVPGPGSGAVDGKGGKTALF